jgi:hypothetical protein
LQVPLVWTVYLMLSFLHFSLIGTHDEARQPGFFEVGRFSATSIRGGGIALCCPLLH